MTFDYPNIRETVAEPLIAEFGKAATLILPNDVSGGDPWAREPAASTEVAVTVVQTSLEVMRREGFIIEAGDLGFLLSTDGDPSPALADGIMVNGEKFTVVEIRPIQPGATVVAWKLQARR